MFWFFGCEACGILATQLGIEPAPSAMEGEVLTTGLPVKSLKVLFLLKYSWFTMFQVYSKVIQLYIYNKYLYVPFQILFHYKLLQDIEYGSLCSTIALCCLSIIYIVVCVCYSQIPNLSLPSFPLW